MHCICLLQYIRLTFCAKKDTSGQPLKYRTVMLDLSNVSLCCIWPAKVAADWILEFGNRKVLDIAFKFRWYYHFIRDTNLWAKISMRYWATKWSVCVLTNAQGRRIWGHALSKKGFEMRLTLKPCLGQEFLYMETKKVTFWQISSGPKWLSLHLGKWSDLRPCIELFSLSHVFVQQMKPTLCEFSACICETMRHTSIL